MDEVVDVKSDLVHLARLAVTGDQSADVRMFVARLIRKYRKLDPAIATQFDTLLRTLPATHSRLLRRESPVAWKGNLTDGELPVDAESRLSLLKAYEHGSVPMPLLAGRTYDALNRLVLEWKEGPTLRASGLTPTRSAIFVGPPGVGKTLAAKWVAAQLELPLFVLDLTAVMSSLLGRSGSNLRAAIEFAKKTKCILLLDEIDAVAKRRSDETDVGELKRLVTVMLQEVEHWPTTSLLLAATNHPELIDPALWRRFDAIVEFSTPDEAHIREAIKRFLDRDSGPLKNWVDVLTDIYSGMSYSDIERSIQQLRRSLLLNSSGPEKLIEELATSKAAVLGRKARIALAAKLAKRTALSQHAISNATGVSRDTIRKRSSKLR